jgi:hypothetical protein
MTLLGVVLLRARIVGLVAASTWGMDIPLIRDVLVALLPFG